MSKANEMRAVSLQPAGVRQAGDLARLHASLFDPAWGAASFTGLLAHPGAIAFVVYAVARHADEPLELSSRSELRRGAHPNVPSPLWGGRGWGDCRTSDGGVPPTPNPSPRRAEGAPSARRGGESGRGCGRPSGFIVGRVAADEAEILTLGVTPGLLRLGIGRQLVEMLCHAANKRGARRLYLEVAAGNAAALAFYDRLGFRESGRRRGYYARADAPAEDAVNLCLPLGPLAPPGTAVDDSGSVTYNP